MEVTLSDDQEFFRDTTRKFLESECPIAKVRELAASTAGFERDYWRQGAELGLDVAAGPRGPRRRQRSAAPASST